MKRLNYGTMPSKSAFHAAWKEHMGSADAKYPYTLRGGDATSAKRARVPTEGSFSEKQLYGILKKLRDGFFNGDDEAGSIASSILSTIGFEWV